MDLQSEKRPICLCSKSSLNMSFHIRINRKDHPSSAYGSLSAPARNENGLLLLLKLNSVPRFLTLHYCSFTFKFARLNNWIWLFQRKHAIQLNTISCKYTSSIDCLHFPPPPPLCLHPPIHLFPLCSFIYFSPTPSNSFLPPQVAWANCYIVAAL